MVLILFNLGKNNPFDEFGKFTTSALVLFRNCKNGPCVNFKPNGPLLLHKPNSKHNHPAHPFFVLGPKNKSPPWFNKTRVKISQTHPKPRFSSFSLTDPIPPPSPKPPLQNQFTTINAPPPTNHHSQQLNRPQLMPPPPVAIIDQNWSIRFSLQNSIDG